MEINRVLEVLNDVPDYQVFLTVDELKASTHRLADEHPDVVEIVSVGRSRQGDPIEAIKIGDGTKTALLFAISKVVVEPPSRPEPSSGPCTRLPFLANVAGPASFPYKKLSAEEAVTALGFATKLIAKSFVSDKLWGLKVPAKSDKPIDLG